MAQSAVYSSPAPKSAEPCCPACGCSRTSEFLKGSGDQGRRIERGYLYRRCSGCGLRFQPAYSAEEAAALYGDIEDVAEVARVNHTRRPLRCDEDILETMKRLGPGRRLLDVGAGDGYFLEKAVAAGFQCTGTDVSERLAGIATERSGAKVHFGDVCEMELPLAAYDWINLDGVLMYVTEPRVMIRRLAALLAPGGCLRIREYDADSLLARARGTGYWCYGPTRVNVLTRAALRELARDAGLQVHRAYSGTEATLNTWLSMARKRTVSHDVKATGGFYARKVRLGSWHFGSDVAMYLRKPG